MGQGAGGGVYSCLHHEDFQGIKDSLLTEHPIIVSIVTASQHRKPDDSSSEEEKLEEEEDNEETVTSLHIVKTQSHKKGHVPKQSRDTIMSYNKIAIE